MDTKNLFVELNSAGITYRELKLQPFWEPLRNDPSFEKIVVSLAPNK